MNTFKYLYLKEVKDNWTNYLAVAFGVLLMGVLLARFPLTTLPIRYQFLEVEIIILLIFIPLSCSILGYRAFAKEREANTIYYIMGLPIQSAVIAAAKFLPIMTLALTSIVFYFISQSRLLLGIFYRRPADITVYGLGLLVFTYVAAINIGLLMALTESLYKKALILGISAGFYTNFLNNGQQQYSIFLMVIAAVVSFVLVIKELNDYEVDKKPGGYRNHNNSRKPYVKLPPRIIGVMLILILAAAIGINRYNKYYESFNVEINPKIQEFSWEDMLTRIEKHFKRTHNIERSIIVGSSGRSLNFEVSRDGQILDMFIRYVSENKRGRNDTFHITKDGPENHWVSTQYVDASGSLGPLNMDPRTVFKSLDNIPWDDLMLKLPDAQSYVFETEDVYTPNYLESNWEDIWNQNSKTTIYLVNSNGTMTKLNREEVYKSEKYMFFIRVIEKHQNTELYRTAILVETSN